MHRYVCIVCPGHLAWRGLAERLFSVNAVGRYVDLYQGVA